MNHCLLVVKMGRKSYQMFEVNFQQETVLKRFVEILENK